MWLNQDTDTEACLFLSKAGNGCGDGSRTSAGESRGDDACFFGKRGSPETLQGSCLPTSMDMMMSEMEDTALPAASQSLQPSRLGCSRDIENEFSLPIGCSWVSTTTRAQKNGIRSTWLRFDDKVQSGESSSSDSEDSSADDEMEGIFKKCNSFCDPQERFFRAGKLDDIRSTCGTRKPSKLRGVVLRCRRATVPPTVPQEIEENKMCAIHELDLARGFVREISDDYLLRLPSLRVLVLSRNLLTSFPSNLASLKMLEVLDLSMNAIAGPICPSISHCTRLRVLRLEGNRLSGAVPDCLSNCGRLTTLVLGTNLAGGNQITSISNELAKSWPRIEVIEIRNNFLTEIPNALFSQMCPRLHTLDVSANRISEIPETIHLSPSLAHLRASNNLLCTLPVGLAQCKTLRILDVSGNSLCFVPRELVQAIESGFPSIFDKHPPDAATYFRARRHVMVLITGNPCAQTPPLYTFRDPQDHPKELEKNQSSLSHSALYEALELPACLSNKKTAVSSLFECALRAMAKSIPPHDLYERHRNGHPWKWWYAPALLAHPKKFIVPRIVDEYLCRFPPAPCAACGRPFITEYTQVSHMTPAFGYNMVPQCSRYCSVRCARFPSAPNR